MAHRPPYVKAMPDTPPTCPKCGSVATEKPTRYGPRSECCGLWSWNRKPLTGGETHAARRKAIEDLRGLHEGGLFDKLSAYAEIAKRIGRMGGSVDIGSMNKRQAEQVSNAVTDIYLAVLTGELKGKNNARKKGK